MAKTRLLVETVLYGAGTFRRFTQDSPIMPEVWANFLEAPRERIQLLIEPWLDTPPAEICVALRARLKIGPETTGDATRTIYNRTLVVSDLTLQEVVKHVDPFDLLVPRSGSCRRGRAAGEWRRPGHRGCGIPEASNARCR